jgi:hypothetical protein
LLLCVTVHVGYNIPLQRVLQLDYDE